jgi:hypothetical protein
MSRSLLLQVCGYCVPKPRARGQHCRDVHHLRGYIYLPADGVCHPNVIACGEHIHAGVDEGSANRAGVPLNARYCVSVLLQT